MATNKCPTCGERHDPTISCLQAWLQRTVEMGNSGNTNRIVVRRFYQLNGWYGNCWKDDSGPTVPSTDSQGYSMMNGSVAGHITSQTKHDAHICILINPDTPVHEAIALLRRAAQWLEKNPHSVTA